MAVNLTEITHGQAGWDKTANSNFNALNQDTGLVRLTMVGAIKGLYQAENAPLARRVNGVVHLTSGIISTGTIPADTKILSMPDELLGADGGITALCQDVTNKGAFPVTIKTGGLFVAKDLACGTSLNFAGITYLGKDV
ncbi:hypothetical protein [Lactiplantibacillus plajomi]|uniref:Uncharacterized protein n=1 Tax=Lactiplantibacillus plajomi TaxID=1457217 RepID=A0ABV6K0X0_9LACO|nr:hypothetical protein [Lactiplantibacillus plajomi]